MIRVFNTATSKVFCTVCSWCQCVNESDVNNPSHSYQRAPNSINGQYLQFTFKWLIEFAYYEYLTSSIRIVCLDDYFCSIIIRYKIYIRGLIRCFYSGFVALLLIINFNELHHIVLKVFAYKEVRTVIYRLQVSNI